MQGRSLLLQMAGGRRSGTIDGAWVTLGFFFPPPARNEPPMETIITLQCGECKRRNYTTVKNKKNDPDRLELRKYCRWCRKHTAHRETR